MSGAEFVEYLAAFSILGLLLYVCVDDFKRLIIENWSVLALLVCYLIWSGAQGFPDIWTDLFMAGLFFLLSLVMWIFRAMGAGDVKLYFALGLLMGMEWAAVFVVMLLIVSVLFWGAMKLSAVVGNERNYIWRRLNQFRTEGVLPYGVVMILAVMPALIGRFFI